jgi:hypothetical protein
MRGEKTAAKQPLAPAAFQGSKCKPRRARLVDGGGHMLTHKETKIVYKEIHAEYVALPMLHGDEFPPSSFPYCSYVLFSPLR